MACVENIPPKNPDSEMEEGEIVDEFDDISSDEELLLRQRLYILETYNNVLERKKAKDFSNPPCKKQKCDSLSQDLSEISAASDFEDGHMYQNTNEKHIKIHKHKRRNEILPIKINSKSKEKKKIHRKNKVPLKVISESSEESDDEYRNKRRKLANAVAVHKPKNDTSSLSARLKKMLYGPKIIGPFNENNKEQKQSEVEKDNLPIVFNSLNGSPISDDNSNLQNNPNNALQEDLIKMSSENELIDFYEDSNIEINGEKNEKSHDVVDSGNKDRECVKEINQDSDEDLELLRKHALETKSSKVKNPVNIVPNEHEIKTNNFTLTEDDESYTAELRLICLKSAYLKKAFEIKRRQKLKKKLSQSSILSDDFILEQDALSNKIDSQNNTDIESVDMEIGSDGDEKTKELGNGIIEDVTVNLVNDVQISKEEEFEEDEDLLRAKLLTSLSKNLPTLMNTSILEEVDEISTDVVEDIKNINPNEKTTHNVKIPEPKKLIIQLRESDSEGEHEATKNLTKMHMKQRKADFEQQLDIFLKDTRKKVENQEIPEISSLNPSEKFVPKSVKHLPKSEQIEYKNLVKKMAELEKMKQARQSALNSVKTVQVKETLKPRNVTVDTKTLSNGNADEQIAVSRKKIAEESAHMIRLREEATKLSQKYKIVATELKNIATAIALNKKQQKTAQIRLSKIRLQHQMLLKSSNYSHSQSNGFLPSINRNGNKSISTIRLQKENNPRKDEYKNPQILKSMKVSVVNDLNEATETSNPSLSVKIDIISNNKIVTVPKIDQAKEENTEKDLIKKETDRREAILTADAERADPGQPDLDKEVGTSLNSHELTNRSNILKTNEVDDYTSPLQALDAANWEADPNAFLCPYEVGGHCQDPDCKYLHPKIPSLQ